MRNHVVSSVTFFLAARPRRRRGGRACAHAGRPLRPPPPLASIHEGAMQIDADGRARTQPLSGARRDLARLPALSRGERSAGPDRDPGAWLIRPSRSKCMPLRRRLRPSGVTAVAVDIRGHGASGTRGDIAYPGQLDDDLADLVAELRKADPAARFSLIGHSAGGGFALRIAGEPLGGAFDRFVLLSPYLGYAAPTNRPAQGPASGPRPTCRASSRPSCSAGSGSTGRSRCRSSPSPMSRKRKCR